MQPAWLEEDALASDADLRELQLRWMRDELWMRRIAFSAWAVALLALMVALTVQRSGIAATAGAASGLLTAPVAYYFGRRRNN